MNDADKLAIAEEIVRELTYEIELKGMILCRCSKDNLIGWSCFYKGLQASWSECPIEAVYLARQKLAAEREAAKSPRERRIEKALADVTDYAARWFFSPRGTELLVAAREALKE